MHSPPTGRVGLSGPGRGRHFHKLSPIQRLWTLPSPAATASDPPAGRVRLRATNGPHRSVPTSPVFRHFHHPSPVRSHTWMNLNGRLTSLCIEPGSGIRKRSDHDHEPFRPAEYYSETKFAATVTCRTVCESGS